MARRPGGVSEYELIRVLQSEGHFDGWISSDTTLALFQKHFAVMHVCYRLQAKYAEDNCELLISPLRIQLSRLSAEAATQAAEGQQVSRESGAVAAFYRDWSHFESATPESVVELLSDFWRRFDAADQTSAALETLGLPPESDWPQIQARYRRLAAEHHPDRGGDRRAFSRVREAYESLKLSVSKR